MTKRRTVYQGTTEAAVLQRIRAEESESVPPPTDTRNYFSEVFEDLQARNRRARELRADGWKVESKTVDFADLARCKRYFLLAVRPDYTGPIFGA